MATEAQVETVRGYASRLAAVREPAGGNVGRPSTAEILQVLKDLSSMQVSPRLLKQTTIGREVNHRDLRKHPDKEVRERSHALVARWLAMPCFGRGQGRAGGAAAGNATAKTDGTRSDGSALAVTPAKRRKVEASATPPVLPHASTLGSRTQLAHSADSGLTASTVRRMLVRPEAPQGMMAAVSSPPTAQRGTGSSRLSAEQRRALAIQLFSRASGPLRRSVSVSDARLSSSGDSRKGAGGEHRYFCYDYAKTGSCSRNPCPFPHFRR